MTINDGQHLRPPLGPRPDEFSTDELSTGPDVPEMYRSLGLLYLCGGLLAMLWLALPDRSSHGRIVVAAMAAVAVCSGIALHALAEGRTRRAPLHLVIATIQVVIAVAYVAATDPSNDLRWFWAWATPFSAFFFPRRAAAAHAVWVGLVIAASLALRQVAPGRALSQWAMTMGTVTAATILVAWAAGRMRGSERRLGYLATHDPLTGLPNRRLYAAHAEQALRDRDRIGGTVLVALIDLDDFKLINDTYGHDTGDELLALTAARLRSAARGTAAVIRLGGDEFAIVCHRLEPVDPAAVAQEICHVWATPFHTRDGELWSSGSIGLAIAAQSEATATTLLREADAAMYQAKSPGGPGHALYDDGMRQSAHARLRLDIALRDGLQDQQFRLHFQPILNLQTGSWHGAEALLRWQQPELGLVAPDQFIALAEETRLIVPIGDWVLRRAVQQLACWRGEGTVDGSFVLSINVSPRQLRVDFPATVAAALSDAGVPGHAVALELTESVLLADSPEIHRILAELRGLGVQLHLDDFGTGYSSLAYLPRLQMDLLKIDQSFVAEFTTSPEHRAVITAIAAMASALGIPVTAEGIETEEQLQTLRRMGCAFGQGYLLAPPMPEEDFARRLAPAR